jgi:hypothetical protein
MIIVLYDYILHNMDNELVAVSLKGKTGAREFETSRSMIVSSKGNRENREFLEKMGYQQDEQPQSQS